LGQEIRPESGDGPANASQIKNYAKLVGHPDSRHFERG
jgi:hypothetical protein